jgi:hypothetical protein
MATFGVGTNDVSIYYAFLGAAAGIQRAGRRLSRNHLLSGSSIREICAKKCPHLKGYLERHLNLWDQINRNFQILANLILLTAFFGRKSEKST